jgi:signal transduction histidine kinase
MVTEPTRPQVRVTAILVVAAAYVCVARASLLLALPPSSASPVWPTTGLALAAVLALGSRVWPGIAIGAFLTNLMVSLDHSIALPVALWTSMAITVGNTAEAVLGAYLVRRFAGGSETFDRVDGVVRFVVLAALISTLISASVGATTLAVGGIVPWTLFGAVWRTWWLGDSAGAIVVTPLLLAWSGARFHDLHARQIAEVAMACVVLVAVGQIVFAGGYPLAYLLVPFLFWAAFRFGQRGASAMTFIISGIATWGTILQRGPFVRGTLNDSLLFLQVFIGVFAVTSMVMAAVLGERAAARRRAEVAAGEAERANRAKTEFLAVMSHELRTPLNAVIGYADLLADEVVGPINETQRAHLGRVQASAQHLVSLIDGVLALARGDAVRDELHLELTDVCALGRQSAALLEAAAAAKGLRIDLAVPSEPQIIETDETKVRQILINLLSNAIKFTDRGAIGLTLQSSDGRVAFEVRDTGIGIAPEHHERIFEPFWQVDQSKTRRVGGTGLGLSVTRGFARLLGGDVTLASAPGRGSTFSVVLPVTRARQ